VGGLLDLGDGLTSSSGLYRSLSRIAARLCGQAVAGNTWVAVIAFPESEIAADSFLFYARTRTGWHVWYYR
jgi:hypothetical protein